MIVCNRCGKTIKMKNDIAYEDFIRVCKPWGYFSKKDGKTQEFIICEACVGLIEQEFVIPSKEYDTTEMIQVV